MEAAVDEKANGPKAPTTHEGKIINDWIAPVSKHTRPRSSSLHLN
jgi:hypothetical protein